jgi:hypothetical protein
MCKHSSPTPALLGSGKEFFSSSIATLLLPLQMWEGGGGYMIYLWRAEIPHDFLIWQCNFQGVQCGFLESCYGDTGPVDC